MINNTSLRFFFLLLLGASSLPLFAQMEVSNAAPITPENLISNVFLGDGVEVINITHDGDPLAVGLFEQGLNAIGIDRGIVMSTGRAVAMPGQIGVNSNANQQSSINNSSSIQDDDIRTIVGPGNAIRNLARYTIEFIPTSDTLRFTYAFGSEEYPEYVCSDYNDIFGFFISGPGITGPFENGADNIALIPGTDRFVTINNVNPGTPGAFGQGSNCSGEDGSLAFSQFYNANNGANQPVYDGYTDVFVAEAVVVPCEVYTIKLVIADIFDGEFDSGVFLEAKSFGTGSLDVEIEGLAIDGGLAEGCGEGEIVFTLPNPVEADYDVTYEVSGTAIPDVDYPALPPSIVIPEGESTFRIPISAFEDDLVEGDETIILSVQRDPCNLDTFTLIIKDNILIKPDLGPDVAVCASVGTQLDGTVNVPLPEPPRFVNSTPMSIDGVNVANESEIQVLGVLPVNLGPEAIKQICIDSLEHPWIDDLDIFLVGPDGQFLQLSTDNGADGGNGLGPDLYYNTCFTIDATTNINSPGPFAPAEAVPFTGNWQPEGTFSDLWDGDYSTNGTWKLVVTDDTPGLFGTLFSWSICFNPVYQLEYSWAPADGLSCTDCPDPIANPSTNTTYIMTVTDSYGCIESDTINFEVTPSLQMSPLQCGTATTSSVEVLWTAVAGATSYEVSINGGPWIPASGSLSHVVNGLGLMEEVEVSVRAISGCPTFASTITCQSSNCTPATLDAVPADVDCFGSNTGSVQINVVSGTAPFTYELEGVSNNNGSFINLVANSYIATVTDGDGCAGNITFIIEEPPSPTFEPTIVNAIDCNSDTDGALTVVVTDGNGPYSFDWQDGSMDSILTNVGAGMYSLDLFDAGNCGYSLMLEITEPELLTATVSADSVDCFGTNTGVAWVSPTGGSGPYTYSWEDGQLTDTAFMLVADTYDVVVTDSLNCTFNTTIVVEEPSMLNVTAESNPADCNGDASGSLNGIVSGGSGNYSYSWIDLASGSSVGQDLALINLTASNYELQVADQNGCIGTDQVTISEPDALTLFDLQTNIPTCAGVDDGSATIDVTGGTAPYDIGWDTGMNGNAENTLAAGLHWVVVQDANLCQDSLSFDLDAPVAVTVDLTMTPADCFGEMTGTAMVTPTGGTEPYTYDWSSGATDAIAMNLAAGMVTVDVIDANNCLATGSIEITQPDLLEVSLTGDDPSCFAATNGTITAIPIGGTPPYIFRWANGQNTPTSTGLVAGIMESVEIEDANGCLATASMMLTEPQVLTLSLSSEEQACAGPPNGEASVIPNGGTGPYVYIWSNGQSTETAVGLMAGNYEVTVTDAQSCMAIADVDVSLAESVEIVDFMVTDANCNGSGDGSFSVTLNGGLPPYTWSEPLINLTAGTYALTVTDANNCTDTFSATINEPSAISLSTDIANVGCAGETTGGIDLSVTGGVGPYTYNWSTGSITEDIDNVPAGNYNITVTDMQNCSVVLVNTIEQASELALSAEIENIKCSGAAEGHIESSITGGQPPYTYAWNNGSSESVLSGVTAGLYNLTITDGFGCSLIETFEVTEPAELNASFISEMVSCFGGRDGFLKIEASGGQPPYRYRLDNEEWQASPSFIALKADDYNLWLEDANGCFLSVGTATISEPIKIIADIGETQRITYGDTVEIVAGITGDYDIVEYRWEPFDSSWMSCADCEVLEIFPSFQRDLFLTVIDENGCIGEAYIQVQLTKNFPLEVPTGFTPNGDNANDRLLVHGMPGIEVISFRVWDRWGEQVFEDAGFLVNDSDRGWDGTYRDQELNSGVYLWQVEAVLPDGNTKVINGQVMMIR